MDGLAITLVALVGMVATARLALAPRDETAVVAVVFPPWTSPEQAITGAADAGGRVLKMGRWSSVVIAAPESPDYAARAVANGAWLVADAAALFGCFGSAPQ